MCAIRGIVFNAITWIEEVITNIITVAINPPRIACPFSIQYDVAFRHFNSNSNMVCEVYGTGAGNDYPVNVCIGANKFDNRNRAEHGFENCTTRTR